MKGLKHHIHKITGVMIALCLSTSPMTIKADTVNDILAIYGYEKAVDVTELKQSINTNKQNLQDKKNKKKDIEFKTDAYELAQSNLVDKLTDYDNEIYLLQDELQVTEEYMLSSKLDSVDRLLELDAIYDSLNKELERLTAERVKLTESLESYLECDEGLDENIAQLETEIAQGESAIEEKEAKLSDALALTQVGDVKNVKPPLDAEYRVTSPFGPRLNPISRSGTEYHKGVDLGASLNDKVLAAFDGTVEDCGYNSTMGNYVWLNHSNGVRTVYMHMNKLNVQKGTKVKQYDVIGFAGTTGSSTGVHLHFGLYLNSTPVNPTLLWRS